MKKTYFKIATASILSTVFLCNTASASTLTIKNDDTAEVDVTIEPGEGNIMTPDKNAIRLILKEGEQQTVEVTKKNFDKETFSVVGKVKMPSINNKCGALSMDKNYKIVFTGAKAGGTVCVAEPSN